MKKKYMLAALAFGLSLSAKVMAQVPNYVPTNGLVGWWPFNGNANDESGSGLNGTVTGASLVADRYGNSNAAYNFNSITDKISFFSGFNNLTNNRTISFWFISAPTTQEQKIISYRPSCLGGSENFFEFNLYPSSNSMEYRHGNGGLLTTNYNSNAWNNVVLTINNSSANLYVNGNLAGNIPSVSAINQSGQFGLSSVNTCISNFGQQSQFTGKADDIGLWNRALTQQEITALYNGCSASPITSQPVNSVLNVGSNAQFVVNASSSNTFQWQSNPLNLGWQNVSNNSTYSGATTNTLTVFNTSVSNHNQPFRAIVNAGGCVDTSNVAEIIIGDTCLTTVTDTLIINTTLGLPAPNNENTILIYPNPANDHITIDNGNFTAMAGYSIKITNNAGQQVFQSAINQAQFYVDLSTWSGDGLYFVHLIDAQGSTVTVRKIVLQ